MQPHSSKEAEIASLTSVRGIAAFWVVLFHLSPILFEVLPEIASLRSLVGAGELAVPLFFVLSGYVLGLRYLTRMSFPSARGLLLFWWLRLGRVYPVHFCTLVISLGMVARREWPTDTGHTPGTFVANMLLTHAWDYEFRLSWNFPSWSISSEWFAYLIFPLVAVLLSQVSRGRATLITAGACLLSAGAYALEEYLPFKGLAVVAPTFIGGVGLAILYPPGSHSIRIRFIPELCLLAAIVLPFAISRGSLQKSLYIVAFFSLVAALGATGNQASVFWRMRPLVYLGEISYSLYMTHAITIALLTRFIPLDQLGSEGLFYRLLTQFGCLACILLATTAMFYVVERPLRILSRRVSRPRPAA